MRMTLRELRNIISEAMTLGDSALAELPGSGRTSSWVLWDSAKLEAACVSGALPLPEELVSCVLGYIVCKKNAGIRLDAYEVIRSAAMKGFGPVMYDVAMSKLGKITSDKGSVTASAENVWKVYFQSRPDVKHEPFDDIDDPKTPPRQDDSEVFPGRDALNYAYSGAHVDTSHAETLGTKSLATCAQKCNVKPEEVLALLGGAGSMFFGKRYTNG